MQTWALHSCIVVVGTKLGSGLEAPVQTLHTSGTLCSFYHYGTTALTKVGTTLCHSTWKEMFALNKQFESQLIPDLCYSGNANSSYTFVTVQIGCITDLKRIGCRVCNWWPHTLPVEAQELLLHLYLPWLPTCSPIVENPSCLQTTAASCSSHSWSQTIPHVLLKHISTLPSYSFVPLISRTANVRQGVGGTVVGCGSVEDAVVGQMRISRVTVVDPGTRNLSNKLKI